MAGPAVDLSFRADISNLTKSLATLPGLTEKEAKAMVKGLESNIKKAEKASIRAATKTGQAWKKSGAAMTEAQEATDKYNQKLGKLEHTTGEVDSIFKALGGAIGTVSPELEGMLSVTGDVAGGIEAAARSGTSFAGVLGPVGIAVGIGALAWKHYSDELEAAEDRMRSAAEAAAAMAAAVGQFKADEARIRLELAVSAGEESIDVLRRAQAEDKAAAVVQETREINLVRLADAQKRYNTAKHAEAAALKGSLDGSIKDADAHADAKKELEFSTNLLERRKGVIAGLEKKERDLAAAIFQTGENNRKASKSSGGRTKAIKAEKDAIQELIDTSRGMIPKESLSTLDQLSNQLDLLYDQTMDNAEAGQRLAPVIQEMEAAYDRLQLGEEAKHFEDMTKAAMGMTKAKDPIADAVALLEEMKQTVRGNDAAWKALSPSIQAVGRHVQELKALDVDIELDESGGLQTSIDNIQKLRMEYDRVSAAQDSYTSAHGQSSDAIAARQQRLKEQMDESWNQIGQEVLSTFTTMTQAAAMFAQAGANYASIATNEVVSKTQDEMAEREQYVSQLQNELGDIESQISEATDSETRARLESEKAAMEGRIEAANANTEELKAIRQKEINEAFRNQQNYQIAATVMNTATGIMQAYASLPTPAAIVMTAAIAAMGASQVAMINAQEPPSAHTGGLIKQGNSDEALIRGRGGEGILTAQGVQAIGGADGLAAANAGMGGARPIVVQQVYKHKVLDTVIGDSIKRGGPITQAMNRRSRRGRRNPYRRAG